MDKFLKVSRLIKRRTVAKSAVEAGRVLVNGRKIKPGAVLKEGDLISMNFGRRRLVVQVTALPQSEQPVADLPLYAVISDGPETG